MDKTGGISIVGGDKVWVEDEAICRGDRVRKSDLLRDGVCLGNQRVTCLVGISKVC